MKRTIIWSMAMLIMALLLGACAESKLRMAVATMNRKCPLSLNEAGTLDEVTLDDNIIILKVTPSDAILEGLDEMPELPKLLTKNFLLGLKEGNAEIIKTMSDAQVKVRTVIISPNSSKEYVGEFSSEEIAELMNDKGNSLDAALQSFCETVNKLLPEDIEDGITQTEVLLEDDYLVYKYAIDESKESMSEWKEMKNEIKRDLIEIIRTDPTNLGGRSFLELVIKTNRGLTFRYEGSTSKESVDVIITNTELKRFLD